MRCAFLKEIPKPPMEGSEGKRTERTNHKIQKDRIHSDQQKDEP